MSQTLRRDICNLQVPGVLEEEVQKEDISKNITADLRYACSYWINHLLKCGEHGAIEVGTIDSKVLQVFFERCFLHWLETPSLHGELFLAVTGLLQLELVLQVRLQAKS